MMLSSTRTVSGLRSALATGCALAAMAMAGCGGSDTPRPLTFSLPHVLQRDHPVHLALEKFAEEVHTRSEGTMRIRVQPGSALGSEQELCDNVASDADGFTKISATILETKNALARVFALPYLYRDEAHMWAVLDGPIGRELLDMAVDQNLKGICYFDAGARSFYTRRPIAGIDDLQGIKIRVQRSVMMQKLVESLGASPQQIDFSELYTALDTGVVQGAENNIPSYYTERHYRVAPYFIYSEHCRIPDILLMSARRWNALTAGQQDIIMESAQVAVAYQRELWQEKDAEHRQQMESEGVTFLHPDDLSPFIEASRSVYDDFAGTPVMDIVERIRAVP